MFTKEANGTNNFELKMGARKTEKATRKCFAAVQIDILPPKLQECH
jgi:hypothetical protein